MTMRMSYFRKMEKDGVLAQRSSIMRTCALYGDYVLVIEKEEWYSDSYPVPNVFYVIGIEDNGGFDYTELGIHSSLAEAWEDYNFIVGSGLSCSLTPEVYDKVINVLTGEILEYPIFTKESQLLALAEHLYDTWGYQPVSRRWQERLNQMGVADFEAEDGHIYAYVSVFWNEEHEFYIRQYGF